MSFTLLSPLPITGSLHCLAFKQGFGGIAMKNQYNPDIVVLGFAEKWVRSKRISKFQYFPSTSMSARLGFIQN